MAVLKRPSFNLLHPFMKDDAFNIMEVRKSIFANNLNIIRNHDMGLFCSDRLYQFSVFNNKPGFHLLFSLLKRYIGLDFIFEPAQRKNDHHDIALCVIPVIQHITHHSSSCVSCRNPVLVKISTALSTASPGTYTSIS